MRFGDLAAEILERTLDVFENLVTRTTRFELDIASHYQYTPERLRLLRDGNREFPEYGSVTGFTDELDSWKLSPAQGETLTLRTAEKPRYVVQTELEDSVAFRVDRELETGDRLRWGAYDGEDGWFFEKNDTHDEEEVDINIMRNSSIVESKTVRIPRPITDFMQWTISAPWYDIGRVEFGMSYSDNGEQENPTIGAISRDGERGPRTGNLPVWVEVQRGASSSAIEMEVGSYGVTVKGGGEGITRIKEFVKTVNVDQTNVWIPLFAMRINPDQANVNVQLQRVAPTAFGGNANAEIIVRAFAPENVADAGGNPLQDADFGTPDEIHTQNSAIQSTEAVDQVADSTGTLQTSMTEPGGYQLAFGEITTSSGSKATSDPSESNARATISPDDIAVVMVEAGATGDIRWITSIEEDW